MQYSLNLYNTIGSDETGVGDYLSPIVACATYVNKNQIQILKELGVKDSKLLNDDLIRKISKEIKTILKYKIVCFDQNIYNDLSKKYNAHIIKYLLHLKAINFLEKNINNNEIDFVVIDAFASEKNIIKYENIIFDNNKIDLQKIKSKKIIIEKAESLAFSVAAASIIARSYLLDKMEKQNKKYEMLFPLGTNEIVEKVAKNFVNKYSLLELYNIAKISFKTTKKLFSIDLNYYKK